MVAELGVFSFDSHWAREVVKVREPHLSGRALGVLDVTLYNGYCRRCNLRLLAAVTIRTLELPKVIIRKDEWG